MHIENEDSFFWFYQKNIQNITFHFEKSLAYLFVTEKSEIDDLLKWTKEIKVKLLDHNMQYSEFVIIFVKYA